MNRRNFVKLISLGCLSSQLPLTTGCTHKKFYNPDQDILLGGGRFKQDGEIRHVLAVINLQQRDHQLVDVDFLPHGILIDPNDKKRLVTYEKNGVHAAVIDLSSHTVSTNFQAADNNNFSGHGTFDKSGNVLYCVETGINNKGSITVRDAKNFETIDTLPTFGNKPHHCQLIDDDKILVVSNTGNSENKKSGASIAYIDAQNKSLLERVTLPDTSIDAGHFSVTKDGSLIVSSAPNETDEAGGVSIRSDQHAMQTMSQPEFLIEKLLGEALSISVAEKHRTAAVTHPDANLITFWHIDKRELIKAMSVPNPRGITLSLDRKYFIVSYGIDTSAILVNTKNLNARTETIMQPTFASGEHIVNWSRTLTEIMPTKIYS